MSSEAEKNPVFQVYWVYSVVMWEDLPTILYLSHCCVFRSAYPLSLAQSSSSSHTMPVYLNIFMHIPMHHLYLFKLLHEFYKKKNILQICEKNTKQPFHFVNSKYKHLLHDCMRILQKLYQLSLHSFCLFKLTPDLRWVVLCKVQLSNFMVLPLLLHLVLYSGVGHVR